MFIFLTTTIITMLIDVKLLWLSSIPLLLLALTFSVFTIQRYQEVRRLSEYLRQISSGDYTLDIRDNEEGELSILKNEIYKVTSMLAEQSAELKVDKQQLTEAISDISHQIKTPITSMTVMNDLLTDEYLPTEKRKEFSQNIFTQLERLNWLVSSLLTIAKIDAGTVTFKEERVNVRDLIHHTLENFQIQVDIKQLHIRVTGDDSVFYVGDFHWSSEALTNILNNCMEHTPENGNISIHFEQNALFTQIIISDSGKGIAREDLPYLFHRFYKGKHSSEESVGIGLAMAHEMVTKQGGTIEVDSETGKGTTFYVKFYHAFHGK
ncbi:MAG TPA: HAMP domain-containing sensor histidine kinase [Bacillota bacterium]|nr:HAMP domain-containing sensor histidine kinase [Bacillota bacterium]